MPKFLPACWICSNVTGIRSKGCESPDSVFSGNALELATSGSLLCRNSVAEPNTATRKPTDRKRLQSELRIDASSSTTKAIDCDSGGSVIFFHRTCLRAKCRQRSIRHLKSGQDRINPGNMRKVKFSTNN